MQTAVLILILFLSRCRVIIFPPYVILSPPSYKLFNTNKNIKAMIKTCQYFKGKAQWESIDTHSFKKKAFFTQNVVYSQKFRSFQGDIE